MTIRFPIMCALLAVSGALALGGCTHTVRVEPIKVEPIDITLHIYLKADEKLDSFFDFQDDQVPADTPETAPATTTSEGTGS